MGHGNGTKVDTKADYQQSLVAAKEKTPGEKLLEEQSAKTLGWAAKGDYRDPREGGIFVNYADPAMLHRNRELTMNAGAQGVSALGTPDPNYLASLKTNQAAHQEENDAAQYEGDVKEGVGQAAGIAGAAEGTDISRKMGVLGVSSDLYKANMNRPKWWQYLIQGASQAGAGALSNPALV